jgi:hypothetical protein
MIQKVASPHYTTTEAQKECDSWPLKSIPQFSASGPEDCPDMLTALDLLTLKVPILSISDKDVRKIVTKVPDLCVPVGRVTFSDF